MCQAYSNIYSIGSERVSYLSKDTQPTKEIQIHTWAHQVPSSWLSSYSRLGHASPKAMNGGSMSGWGRGSPPRRDPAVRRGEGSEQRLPQQCPPPRGLAVCDGRTCFRLSQSCCHFFPRENPCPGNILSTQMPARGQFPRDPGFLTLFLASY